ncbi:polysaccharide pyruvyl transferase family protein [Alishewanella jeotgali]|uniref:ExoV-like protein n=1 Tax=Alishewanella jeotgali KCTC 22429 TaxID=1129374 RepID=H3ZB88_9ALTE|nr:polysaccharide pyruvyl transferase family protein [Alishewanella jeotgali]EHR42202.1 ExoV-like protein [Alishewanella jeotgali KCTC 22429]
MRLYYFKDREGNFGDDLNPWLWQQLFPDFFDEQHQDIFVGVGTLLNHRIPPAPSVTVFGSGHGYGELPNSNEKWKFYCVRGPLTAKSLGLPDKLAITDPASLSAQFYTTKAQKRFNISFMPHCESARLGDWSAVCAIAGINYIDPRKHFLDVFDAIRQSELLLTEAMHGAILADSFRVPWIPVKAYPHISSYKWQDWLQSVRIEANFSNLPPIWRGDVTNSGTTRLKNIIKRGLLKTPLWQPSWGKPPQPRSPEAHLVTVANCLIEISKSSTLRLSKDAIFTSNTTRLQETVFQFKRDFGL